MVFNAKCRESTMGFAPEISAHISKWKTPEGEREFLNIVQRRTEEKIGENITLENPNELLAILQSTIFYDEDLQIRELIAYCTQLLVGRIRMHRRIESMRNDNIKLQPRGCYDREKGCMPMAEKSNSESTYANFLKQQQSFRN